MPLQYLEDRYMPGYSETLLELQRRDRCERTQ